MNWSNKNYKKRNFDTVLKVCNNCKKIKAWIVIFLVILYPQNASKYSALAVGVKKHYLAQKGKVSNTGIRKIN